MVFCQGDTTFFTYSLSLQTFEIVIIIVAGNEFREIYKRIYTIHPIIKNQKYANKGRVLIDLYKSFDCRNIESDFKKMIEQKNDI